MRRALPLLVAALAVAGCGEVERTYSDEQVRQAFVGLIGEAQQLAAVPPTLQFASKEAVTELRIDEGVAQAAGVYRGAGLEVLRYRSPREAQLAEQRFVTLRGGEVHRLGNVVLLVLARTPQSAAALDRLH